MKYFDEYRIAIDEEVFTIDDINDYGYLPMISIGQREYYIAQNSETAGEKAREYWEDLAYNDPKEFTCLVGEETLIQWGLNQYAGPGTTQVRSLEEWLNLWLNTPEECWASYDGTEEEANINKNLMNKLGFEDRHVVIYRHN